MKILPYLKVMRISALPTCWSNVLAAFWLGGGADQYGLLAMLLLTSSLCYLGGMVLNDWVDAKIDAVERPERPIPSGQVSMAAVQVLGVVLMIAGMLCAESLEFCGGNRASVSAGLGLLISIVLYDGIAKKIPVVGPITMGLCRFFNILMVLFAVGSEPNIYAGFVFLYITAITILAGYEVESLFVRKLVGIGLSSIILIDAVWCFVFAGPVAGLIVLSLYPVAMGLRRIVSMT